jgi:CheY-like chemotaxis protein
MTQVDTAPAPFVEELRNVLQHLYDPTVLSRTPMLAWLGAGEHHNPPTALRRLLVTAIGALKPGNDVPVHSNAWRIHQVLTWRYVEQSSQRDVAANLAISPRQLRRLERTAAQALADYLWRRYDLSPARLAPAEGTEATGAETGEPPDRQQELHWLRSSFPEESMPTPELVHAACNIIRPLASDLETEITCDLPSRLPSVTGQVTPLRQALLNLMTLAVHAAPGGQVCLKVRDSDRGLIFTVRATANPIASSSDYEEAVEHLKMARQFARILDATLDVLHERGAETPFVAKLQLPNAGRSVVLVIEDNVDALHLFERYLSDTPYRMLSARDPQQAISLAEASEPDVIVLDIMLPKVDGWELLGRLREHPQLGGTPIIVSTILPQEKLALTLGAAAFLRKPFSRRAFLDALSAQLDSAPQST